MVHMPKIPTRFCPFIGSALTSGLLRLKSYGDIEDYTTSVGKNAQGQIMEMVCLIWYPGTAFENPKEYRFLFSHRVRRNPRETVSISEAAEWLAKTLLIMDKPIPRQTVEDARLIRRTK